MRNLVDRFVGDVRTALRAHVRAPLVTTLAVAVLALGIAASSVSLAIVDAFFVRNLPIAASDRFIHVYRQTGSDEPFPISFPDYADIRALRPVFDGAIAEAPAPLTVRIGSGHAERMWGEIVSDDYFHQLGLAAQAGRLFTSPEDGVVLSDAVWRRRFGASPAVLGTAIAIEGRSYRIAGVAPAGFGGTIVGFSADLWIPLRAGASRGADSPMRDDAENRGEANYFVMARLAPSATVEQARSALATLASRIEREFPETSQGLRLIALTQSEGRFPTVRDRVFGASMLAIVVAVLVTLIACANIAGLLLARAAERRTDIGVRLALGAPRGRIIGQLLTESALIAVAAGVVGIVLAWQITELVSGFKVTIARGASAGVTVALSARILAISVAGTMLAGILCGVTPAFESLKTDVIETLRRRARGRTPAGSRPRRVLLAAQVAVSMLLLAGGGLFLRSFQSARAADLGFSPDGVVATMVDIRARGDAAIDSEFWTRVLDRARSVPGVERAALSYRLPLELGLTRTPLAPYPYTAPPSGRRPETEFSAVSPGYFSTVGIALLDGRDFDDRDVAGAPRTVILNDVLAERFWPGQRAVGRLVTGADDEPLEVIGVVRRSKYMTIGEAPTAYLYVPLRQGHARSMHVVALAPGGPRAAGERIAAAVRQLDGEATADVGLLADRVRLAMAPAAGSAFGLAAIGVLALALTALGLFGAVAHTVGARTYEIGVRRALGAPDWRVARLVLGDTATLVTWGLAAGLGAALAASRPLRALLYTATVTDPWAFGLAPIVLLASCGLAIGVPTSRALRISAATALRAE